MSRTVSGPPQRPSAPVPTPPTDQCFSKFLPGGPDPEPQSLFGTFGSRWEGPPRPRSLGSFTYGGVGPAGSWALRTRPPVPTRRFLGPPDATSGPDWCRPHPREEKAGVEAGTGSPVGVGWGRVDEVRGSLPCHPQWTLNSPRRGGRTRCFSGRGPRSRSGALLARSP